mgnify:CR=1 FL=1
MLDIFGVPPRLFIENSSKFKTNFGLFLTLLLLGLVVCTFWVYGNDIYYREKPITIFTEESQPDPPLVNVKNNTLNFA